MNLNKRLLNDLPNGIQVQEILLRKNKIKLAPFKTSFFNIEPGVTTPVDCHKVREIWLIISGQGLLSTNGIERKIKAEDAVYFDSLQPHSVKNIGTVALKIISIWWPHEISV